MDYQSGLTIDYGKIVKLVPRLMKIVNVTLKSVNSNFFASYLSKKKKEKKNIRLKTFEKFYPLVIFSPPPFGSILKLVDGQISINFLYRLMKHKNKK